MLLLLRSKWYVVDVYDKDDDDDDDSKMYSFMIVWDKLIEWNINRKYALKKLEIYLQYLYIFIKF